MDDERTCLQCGRVLENRRSDAVFCRQRCRRRYYRGRQSSKYMPPLASTSPWAHEDRADERFRRQLADHQGVSAHVLTPAERAWQSRNPGVLPASAQQRIIDADLERRRLEAAERERSQDRAISVETPLDPSTIGSVARQGRASRAVNRPTDPYAHRPGQSGPSRYPTAPDAEMIDAPWGRSTPRSAIGW